MEDKLAFVWSLIVYDDGALLDDEYLRQCFSDELRARNHGYLSLVSPAIFSWGIGVRNFLGKVANTSCLKAEGRDLPLS